MMRSILALILAASLPCSSLELREESNQSAASRPTQKPDSSADSPTKLLQAAIDAASQLGTSKCTSTIDVRQPADAPSAMVTGTCSIRRNADGRYRSEVELVAGPGVSAGKITLLRDKDHFALDVQQAGEERQVLRAPSQGLYWLEWSGAQGIQGALPPKEVLEELGKGVDWDFAGDGLHDGRPCLELRGRTKVRTMPPASVALPAASTCRVFLGKDSKELLAMEFVDSQGAFKYTQRYQSVRSKDPFPDATFRIADAGKVQVTDVKEPDWKLQIPSRGLPKAGEEASSKPKDQK